MFNISYKVLILLSNISVNWISEEMFGLKAKIKISQSELNLNCFEGERFYFIFILSYFGTLI